jgi:hypothetical protein
MFKLEGESTKDYFKRWTRDQKLKAVVAAGGRCLDCGFDDLDRLECFHFDHRDPMTKAPGITRAIQRLAKQVREQEYQKCDLVCSNCHATRNVRRYG